MMKNQGEQRLVPKLRFKGFSEDWEQRELGELSNIRRGASPRPISDPKWFSNESDIGWIRISDVTEQNGRIKNVEQKLSNLGMEKTLILDEGELILSIAASVGKPVINYIKTGIHDGFIVFLNPQFHRDFMFAWLERNQFIWNRYGQPGSQVNINSEIVKKQKVLLPNIKEQEKISNMILKFEDMITLHNKRLNTIECIIDAYRHRLLEGHLKFLGSSKTSKIKLSELMEVRDERFTLDSGYELMSFVAYNGVTPKNDRYNREFLVKNDKKKYKLTKLNDLIYSSNNLDIGSININKTKDALISDVYEVFKIKDKTTPEFVNVLIKSEWLIHEAVRFRQGALYGQYRLYSQDFLNIEVSIPSYMEQLKISQLLTSLEIAHDKINQKVELLKQLKQEFLNKLFI